MAKGKSFTEYVKNKFDDLIWNQIEKFIACNSNNNFDSLELRLRQIEQIKYVELADVGVRFVNVSDLPNSFIKFDILVEAELYVFDRYHSRNDRTENVRQWFKIECVGSLNSNLDDTKVNHVSVYVSKERTAKPMSDALVPIIYKNQLEDFANEIVEKYYPDALKEPMYLDPYEFSKKMNLTVLQKKISEDGSIFGQVFFKNRVTTFFDNDNNEVLEEVKKGTIVVDPNVAFQINCGALNNTIIHECVHWELHQKAFQLERLFNEDASFIQCQVKGGIVGGNSDATKFMEWQANALAPKIQMPLEMFKKQVEFTIAKYRREQRLLDPIEWIEPVIDDLAQFFGVSRLAAKIRMIDAGYEAALGAFIYIDGKYVPPHRTFRKQVVNTNQTFSIPFEDLAVLMFQSPELSKLVNSSSYSYVESHVVLNLPLYVEKDLFGNEYLTEYARKHMEECCLLFEVKAKRDYSEQYYQTICVLNRDKQSPIVFEMKFVNGFENSTEEKQKEALNNMLSENTEMFMSLTGDYKVNLNKLMEWRQLNYKKIAEKVNVSAETVGRCMNGKTTDRNTLILICLAMHLPYMFTEKILNDAGCPLVPSKIEHQYYRFVLENMYSKEITEIREFLNKQNVPTI